MRIHFRSRRTTSDQLDPATSGLVVKVFLWGGLVAFPLIMGAWLAFAGTEALLAGMENENWPKAKGVVTQSEMSTQTRTVRERSVATDAQGFRKANRKTTTSYQAQIAYEFEVGGKKYTSNKIDMAFMKASGKEDNQARLNRYAAGTAVEVAYNPNDPYQAVLETGTSFGDHLAVGLSLLMLGFGGFMLTSLLTNKSDQQDV